MLAQLVLVSIAGISALGAYFYFRPPRLKPLSDEGLRNAIRVAIRQSQDIGEP